MKTLIQMYSTQSLGINWKGYILSEFSVYNCLKQGAVLSPLLPALYLDDLLKKLRNAGLECHINGMSTGAFIYADDITITLITPSRESISYMLQVYEQYTTKHVILFNPAKSQCLFSLNTVKCVHLTPYILNTTVYIL